MIDRLHIKPRHCKLLEDLLHEHLSDIEVWVCGSRINGRAHDGSDLDLILRAPNLVQIPANQLADFEEAWRESTIPFLLDAWDWARLHEHFNKEEIARDHVVLRKQD